MIYGIGTDIIQIARIHAVLARHGEHFVQRVLGEEELAIYHSRAANVPVRGIRFLATRFAAKEAFSKAIGLGMHTPMTWRAMQMLNEKSGKPVIATSGKLKQFMQENNLWAQVTVSDEMAYAVAFVIVEKT